MGQGNMGISKMITALRGNLRDQARKSPLAGWQQFLFPQAKPSKMANTHAWSAGSDDCLAEPSRSQAAEKHNRVWADGKVTASKTDQGILWVDGVGGYMVLLKDELVLGQAIPGNDVDIPLIGDLSREHAILRRADDTYLIEPRAAVSVGGYALHGVTPLNDGDEIELGPSVHMRFRQPTPLSDTARLNVLSHHRTQPYSDGILLFGQTCLIGNNDSNHIRCPDCDEQIVISRTEDGNFRFRANQRVEIDGISTADTGILEWNANLSGPNFALRFEQL